MSEAAISIVDLQKTYARRQARARRKITLDVPRGGIFGLLGPNGAGKSTLINILAGLVTKSGGTATIWGFDIDAHPRNAKRSIGVVPQEILFRSLLHPARGARNPGRALRASPKPSGGRWRLLRAMRLEDKAEAYARTLSGGMKRRLLVAKAMVHSATDPGARRAHRRRRRRASPAAVDLHRSLHAQGVTIVLTTHYLEEAEQLCDRIAIINHGKLIANEATRTLVGMAQEKVVEVTVDRDVVHALDASCFDKVELMGARTLAITYRKDRVNAGEVLAALQREGLGIVDVSTREADLEDVFPQPHPRHGHRWLRKASTSS